MVSQIPDVRIRKSRYSYGHSSLHSVAYLPDFDKKRDKVDKNNAQGEERAFRVGWFLKKVCASPVCGTVFAIDPHFVSLLECATAPAQYHLQAVLTGGPKLEWRLKDILPAKSCWNNIIDKACPMGFHRETIYSKLIP